MTDELIEVEGIRKAFAVGSGETLAIENVSLSMADGEFLSLVGPSGCGKTTLLRAVSGLLKIDAGEIRHRGARSRACSRPCRSSSRSTTAASSPGCPWTATSASRCKGVPKAEADQRVGDALRVVGLEDFAGHYPWQLSGGMQQRVAIARSVAAQAEILLMDEPFASVDAQTRISLEMMLLELWERLSISVLFVTHDIEEAILLSDRVLVLSQRPSRVIAEIEVDLPRPRDQLKTKELPRFLELREEIYALVGLREREPA